jgi:hypothetical protein
MRIVTGVSADQARQTAQHRVFVEGNNDEAIDPVVIRELLTTNGLTQVDAHAMGHCDNVRSAAEALIRQHPSYYFLIDRDDQSSATVEATWDNFPDPATHNLLIWRKRELENYFIDPDFLCNSDYLHVSKQVLSERIRSECQRRVFLDSANLVLCAMHREVRRPFAQHFGNPVDFTNEAEGLQQLENLQALPERCGTIRLEFGRPKLRRQYRAFVRELSGSQFPLQYGTGKWLDRISGKEVFRAVAGSCFRVRSASRTVLQGKDQHNEIAKNLLRKPLAIQPTDFRQLVTLLTARAGA